MLTLGIDLSTLTPGELQQLLRSARDRGEVMLAERLQAELTARRRGPVRSRTPWAAADVVQAARLDDEAEAEAPGPRRTVPLAVALAAAAALSVGAGWWATRTPSRAEAAPPPPAVAATPAPATLPVEVAAPPPPVAQPAPVAQPQRTVRAHPARVAAAPSRRIGPLDCGVARERADRMVCGDHGLSAQHRAMRAAYERAIAAGADRLRLDHGQATWRKARAHASSRAELRDLYAARIAALRAAARR